MFDEATTREKTFETTRKVVRIFTYSEMSSSTHAGDAEYIYFVAKMRVSIEANDI